MAKQLLAFTQFDALYRDQILKEQTAAKVFPERWGFLTKEYE